jgi:septum formation protein
MSLVLASASRARRHILEAAGLEIAVDPAELDERAIKTRCRRDGLGPGGSAAALAEAKAALVTLRHPGAMVIGADQMLDCGGEWLDKPRDPAEARRQLILLRGRSHTLHAAVTVARDGNVLWQHVEPARLAMRRFSDPFLDTYLAAMGARICETVGGYQLEGLGAQLFDRIEGDHFAILGLPLLPLLSFLREQGAIAI